MKKDRNTFFSEYGFNNNQRPNMMMPGGGMQPADPMHQMVGWMHNPGHHNPGHMPMPNDIDSRIAKLERALNRLETRVSKLEGEYQNPMPLENDYSFNNSMYMV